MIPRKNVENQKKHFGIYYGASLIKWTSWLPCPIPYIISIRFFYMRGQKLYMKSYNYALSPRQECHSLLPRFPMLYIILTLLAIMLNCEYYICMCYAHQIKIIRWIMDKLSNVNGKLIQQMKISGTKILLFLFAWKIKAHLHFMHIMRSNKISTVLYTLENILSNNIHVFTSPICG